jgi:glutamate 5-kinase
MRAGLLIILSDVDGLYSGDPRVSGSKLISFVDSVTPQIENLATGTHEGFGGMGSKLKAAKIVTEAGLPVVIANAAQVNAVRDIVDGMRVGTFFKPGGKR